MPNFVGTSGDDTIDGSAGDDQIFGRAGNDTLSGGDGNDGIFGEDGDDVIHGGTGLNTVSGGAGADILTVSGGGGNYLYSDSRDGTAGGDDFLDVDRLTGSAGGDLFTVGYNDIVVGGGGSDFVVLSVQGAPSGVTIDFRPLATGGAIANGTGSLAGMTGYSLTGSRFDDVFFGYSVDFPGQIIGQGPLIDGREGNDTITGGLESDDLNGGAGSDVLRGGTGNDFLYSGWVDPFGNDRFDRGLELDMLYGDGGDDFIMAGVGDTIDGGAGLDVLLLNFELASSAVVLDVSQISTGTGQLVLGGRISNAEAIATLILPNYANIVQLAGSTTLGRETTVYGGSAVDTVTGGERDETIYGAGGNDVLGGGGGNDALVGDAGDDILEGGLGINGLTGGAGFDLASYASATSRVNVNLGVQNQFSLGAGTDSYGSIEGIIGSAFDDVIRGGFLGDTLYGMNGNDLIFGLGGDDRLEGGAGANVLAGGDGNDTIVVTTSGNELSGGQGSDIFIVISRIDTIIENAGEGFDEVRTTASVYVLPNNVESLTFTDNAAHAAGYGNALDNTLRGGTGYDGLVGDAGNDLIIGGAGAANELIGGTGDDSYFVTAAGDTIVEFANEGIDTVITTLSTYTLRANVENLTHEGSSAFGGVGNSLANRMQGGTGDDTLVGLGGSDFLFGGLGADLLIGGTGADQFYYEGFETGYDRITDFTSGSDTIVLNGNNFSRNGTIRLISAAGASANSDDSAFLYDTSTGILSYDADGSGAGAAVQLAQLNTGLTLALSDFVFV